MMLFGRTKTVRTQHIPNPNFHPINIPHNIFKDFHHQPCTYINNPFTKHQHIITLQFPIICSSYSYPQNPYSLIMTEKLGKHHHITFIQFIYNNHNLIISSYKHCKPQRILIKKMVMNKPKREGCLTTLSWMYTLIIMDFLPSYLRLLIFNS